MRPKRSRGSGKEVKLGRKRNVCLTKEGFKNEDSVAVAAVAKI